MDIKNEARKHLLFFLLKVMDDSYTQNEFENFFILTYQDTDLETIRQLTLKIIKPSYESNIFKRKQISSEDKVWIEGVISDLKSASVLE